MKSWACAMRAALSTDALRWAVGTIGDVIKNVAGEQGGLLRAPDAIFWRQAVSESARKSVPPNSIAPLRGVIEAENELKHR